MAAFGCASAAASTGRRSRPCADSTSASAQSRPSRAKASATEETAGSTTGVAARARSARTMPKKPGSPEASTTAGPRAAQIASSAVSSCWITMTLAAGGTLTEASCRRAPATTDAPARALAAAGVRGLPSHPITVTVMPVSLAGRRPAAPGR